MDKQNLWRACMDRDVMYGPTESVWRGYGHGYNVWTNRKCMDRDVIYGQMQNIWRKCMDKHSV